MDREARILFFTLHKSASMFVFRVCRSLAAATGQTLYSPNGGDALIPQREMASSTDFWIRHQTGCFGPLRYFVDVPGMANDRIVLHLRDPRDLLVSMFYSYCYSHGGPVAGGEGYRKEVANAGIDDFVIKMATSKPRPVRGDYGTGASLWDRIGNVAQRYRSYETGLLDAPDLDVVLVRYEDMVADVDAWLATVAAQFGVSGGRAVRRLGRRFRRDVAAARANEQQWAHQRKVTPGDHVEKLAPETIARLNDIFEPTLRRLGYGS